MLNVLWEDGKDGSSRCNVADELAGALVVIIGL